jgi:hypothetical protein
MAPLTGFQSNGRHHNCLILKYYSRVKVTDIETHSSLLLSMNNIFVQFPGLESTQMFFFQNFGRLGQPPIVPRLGETAGSLGLNVIKLFISVIYEYS